MVEHRLMLGIIIVRILVLHASWSTLKKGIRMTGGKVGRVSTYGIFR